jgi:hypothetical protein
MTKPKEKEPTMRSKRNELKVELMNNFYPESMMIHQHRPWTYVQFKTWHKGGKKNGRVDIEVWGVSKICWPDQTWESQKGVDVAIDRALAWAVKEIIPAVVDGTFELKA